MYLHLKSELIQNWNIQHKPLCILVGSVALDSHPYKIMEDHVSLL